MKNNFEFSRPSVPFVPFANDGAEEKIVMKKVKKLFCSVNDNTSSAFSVAMPEKQ